MKILDNGKKLLSNWSRKHVKLLMVLYTLLVLMAGITLGCMYDGRGDLGEFYFKINGKLYYIGAMQ